MQKQKFLELCKKNNVTFTDEGDCLKIDPPDGHHFRGSQFHSCDIYNTHGQWKRAEIYDELAKEMEMGIEPCNDECGGLESEEA